ncbi:uncharacterized protein STEHIDRAFT_171604 [Stereum hirsutum FP-91666 SS1]|uniref:uncharacterized protein n=1 Tax=Stereum hirsutum (strain FP-91666) TaxID=721885 RepID=UPI000444A091|nr:uncharacterized protein STEHIDRAFT_171604 [Stereum hirsutum FP-91666 SS1]EIM81994.1 hypothetical protein STEHIDRAFT_171604 [Stereum hirsutum FP-91666 SS1]
MLLDLPLELQMLVYKHAPKTTLVSLMCTSSHIHRIVEPILYREVIIDDQASEDRMMALIDSRRARGFINTTENISESDLETLDGPTSFSLFRKTLMRKPFHFGPLLKSLEINEVSMELEWDELKEMFLTMPNLLTLSITSAMGGWDDDDVSVLSRVTPSIRSFSSKSLGLSPKFISFLETHPNLKVWHHGTGNGFLMEPEVPVPAHVLSRITHYDAAITDAEKTATLLRGMTNLAHLSLSHSASFKETLDEAAYGAALRTELGALSVCGKGLVSLFYSRHFPTTWRMSTPGPGRWDSFLWIVRNILPRTPSLQHLRVDCWFLDTSTLIEPPSDIRPFIPKTLRTFQVVRPGLIPCDDDSGEDEVERWPPTTEVALRVARVVSAVMPSVERFDFLGCDMFKGNDGIWRRNTSSDGVWPLNWAIMDLQYRS